MKLSCCFIQTDSSAPNTVCLQSSCNPTLKFANFSNSQHHIASALSSSPHHFFQHLSYIFSRIFLKLLPIPSLSWPAPAYPLYNPLHSSLMTSCQAPRDSLSCCDGRGLCDTSCSFNDFAPRPRSARVTFFFPTFRLDFGITSKGWCQTMISIVLVTAAHIEMDLRTVL